MKRVARIEDDSVQLARSVLFAATRGDQGRGRKAGGSRLYLYARQQGLWPKIVSGHDPDSEPKAFNPYCPVRHVTKKYPPTFLVHGDKDTDVPYQQSVMMAKELASKGVAHEFITTLNGGHGFSRADAEFASKTYDQVVSFLNRYLK